MRHIMGTDSIESIGRAIIPADEFAEINGMKFCVRDWTARVLLDKKVTIECVCIVVIYGEVWHFDGDKQIRADALNDIKNPDTLTSNDGRIFSIINGCWKRKILPDRMITVTFLSMVSFDEG